MKAWLEDALVVCVVVMLVVAGIAAMVLLGQRGFAP